MTHYLHPGTGFIVSFEDDEDGWVVAEVPALPGCIAQGRGLRDTAANLSAAIEDYLDILKEDEPARYDELMAVSGATNEDISIQHDATSSWVGFMLPIAEATSMGLWDAFINLPMIQ